MNAGRRSRTWAWLGAAVALATSTMLLFGWSIADQTPPGLAGAAIRIAAVDLGVAIVVGGVVTGLAFLVLRRRRALPWPYLWMLLASLIVLVTLGGGASQRGWYVAIAVVVIGTSLVGAGVGGLLTGGTTDRGRRRTTGLVLLAAGVVVLGVPGLWLTLAGTPPPDEVAAGSTTPVEPEVADLTRAGPYEVDTASYGSGDDARSRYGEDAEVTSEPVDGSALLDGWGERRTAHWGFGPDRLPVNGQAWYPAESGEFPLVLIAHGNSSSVDASELGFSYLAEHLASHGFVAVAVDHNYLNTGILDRAGGASGLETARAWLLLQHLDRWRAWADEPDHPLGAKVDMTNVGLVGHSRGGAAIAVATRLNDAGELPDRPDVEVPHDFAIDALLALAPARAQDPSTGEADPALEEVSYLTIQGSHDADIGDFVGLDQYEQVVIEEGSDRLKAALYVEAANHAQFNDRWGRHDLGNGLPKHFLDTTALLAPDEQRRLTMGYATGFFATALGGDDYRDLLADHRTGAAWLPTTRYVNQYLDDATTTVEDADDAGAAWERLHQEGFSAVEVVRRPARTGPATDAVTEFAWPETDASAELTIELPPPDVDGTAAAQRRTHVVLDAVADTTLRADAVTVTIADRGGKAATSSLADLGLPLQGLVDGRYLKAGWLHATRSTEPVPQTFRLPLSAFVEQEPDLDPDDLAALTIRIETTAPGTLLLDDVGVASGP